MTFCCWATNLFSRSCHDLVIQMFPVVNISTRFAESMINLSYPWRFECNSAMNQVQLLASDPRTGRMTSSYMTSSQATKALTSITPRRKEVEPWARRHCICLVKMHRLISTDTWVIYRIRSDFQTDLSGSICISFVASREKYDGVSRFSLSFLAPKLSARTLILPNNNIFLPALGRSRCDLRW